MLIMTATRKFTQPTATWHLCLLIVPHFDVHHDGLHDGKEDQAVICLCLRSGPETQTDLQLAPFTRRLPVLCCSCSSSDPCLHDSYCPGAWDHFNICVHHHLLSGWVPFGHELQGNQMLMEPDYHHTCNLHCVHALVKAILRHHVKNKLL